MIVAVALLWVGCWGTKEGTSEPENPPAMDEPQEKQSPSVTEGIEVDRVVGPPTAPRRFDFGHQEIEPGNFGGELP